MLLGIVLGAEGGTSNLFQAIPGGVPIPQEQSLGNISGGSEKGKMGNSCFH